MLDALQAELNHHGIPSLAPDLPGHGASAETFGDLYADTQLVADTLARIDGPVVLVGHSYGGAVIGEAATRHPDNVAHLVYLTAFCLDEGEALLPMVQEKLPQADIPIAGGFHLLEPSPFGEIQGTGSVSSVRLTSWAGTVSIVTWVVAVVGPFCQASCARTSTSYRPSGRGAPASRPSQATANRSPLPVHWSRTVSPSRMRTRHSTVSEKRPLRAASSERPSPFGEKTPPAVSIAQIAGGRLSLGTSVAVSTNPSIEASSRPLTRTPGVPVAPIVDAARDDPQPGPRRERADGGPARVVEGRPRGADLGIAGDDQRRGVDAGIRVRGAGHLVGGQARAPDERSVVAARGGVGVGEGLAPLVRVEANDRTWSWKFGALRQTPSIVAWVVNKARMYGSGPP